MEGHMNPPGCHCKRSRCLKKYCDCFAAGSTCGKHCRCIGCCNVEGHPNRGNAVKKSRRRLPPTGCSCKKSGCLKKYCICFGKGVACDPMVCKCADCGNTTTDTPQTPRGKWTRQEATVPRKKQRTCPAVVTMDDNGNVCNIRIFEDRQGVFPSTCPYVPAPLPAIFPLDLFPGTDNCDFV